jgi:hypothetical protein
MFRKQISPKTTAIAVVIILGLVQFVYWRLLVYQPRANVPVAGGGGAVADPIPTIGGREDIEVRTYAGEAPGYRDGGLWEARFCGPNALALGEDGSLYIADSRNHRIRRITPAGQVSTFAGSGPADSSGGRGDGPATSGAQFRYPSGVAVDAEGAILVADTGNHRICRVESGTVTTIAGAEAGRVDGPARSARFSSPATLATTPDGALWIADAGNQAIRRLGADGVVSTPVDVPAEVRATLGDLDRPSQPTLVAASEAGIGVPATTNFPLGRRGPGAPVGAGAALYGDLENYVLMLGKPHEPPLLIAGRRVEGRPPAKGAIDGNGLQSSFALPCAAVRAPSGVVYLADYEAHTIRQVRLPAWLTEGEAAPVPAQRGRRRRRER